MSCNWPLSTLGDFVSLFTGFPFKSKQFSDVEGTKLLRGDNVVQGTLRWENVKRWTDENLVDKHKNYLLRESDVILAMDRPWIEAGLKFSQIESRDLPCYLVQRVACLRANDRDDQDFLKFIVGSRAFTEYVKLVQTGTAVPHISGKQILAFEFRLPPKDIRLSIGKTLSDIDKKVSLNTQTNQTLEEMAQVIFKSWFVDFDPVKAKMNGEQPEGMDAALASLFPEKLVESELGLIPDGWDASSMGEHFNITMGQSPKGETYNEDGEGIAFFQGRRDFGFRYPDVRVYTTDPKRHAKAGDTLVSVRAPVGDKNMAAIDCCIGRGVAAIKHKSQSRSFTYAFVSHIEKKLSDSGSSGTVFSSINQNELKKVSFVAPPQDLIEAFHKLVDPIDQKIEVLSEEIKSLSALRDTLLPKLLSGEIELAEKAES